MSPCSGAGDRRWSLAMDPNLAMERPGLTRRRPGRAARKGLRESARGRMRQRRTAPAGTTKLMQARLIRVEGLRVAELPRPI